MKIKRLFLVVLCLSLVLSAVSPAFASEIKFTPGDYSFLEELSVKELKDLRTAINAILGDDASSGEQKAASAEPTHDDKMAAIYFTQMAHLFKNPLSLKVLNAWHSTDYANRHIFTFHLSLQNGVGNVVDAYYGSGLLGAIEPKDYTENGISSVAKELRNDALLFGMDGSFRKDAVDAMRNGAELNAEYIQDYFMKHYY